MSSSEKIGSNITVSERVKKAMQNLGLTDYEIRAYLPLIQIGPLTASELSNIAEIPYSKIYEVLGSLEEKGWVEVEGGRPARYHAKSPVTAVETMKLKLEEKLQQNSDIIISELMPIFEDRWAKEKPDIWILRGEHNILTKLKELIANCERELLLATPMLPKEILRTLLPFFITIKGKNGRVQIMLTSDTDQQTLRKIAEVAEVRIREHMFGCGAIRDLREVMIIFAAENGKRPAIAIWSEHTSLAKFARDYFDYLWNSAYTVKKV
ncbi:MAG: helix-turn-helix domain-containing protein [Nitrososphaerota archaeon]|nr:TrmB family transcriptional regulator [Aigarchaeota archaeon]MDW8076502.1 helix-turn-helix domain-containing protein [Nitrososphaerota archaeon]